MLEEIRSLIAAHARPDLRTPIDGLLLSRVTSSQPDYSMTEPLLVVMAQGGKRLLLGNRVFEYGPGNCSWSLPTCRLPDISSTCRRKLPRWPWDSCCVPG